MGKRELVALLNLSSWCLVMVERLFLAVPWGCLQFVIVVFPDYTHLLFIHFFNFMIKTHVNSKDSSPKSLEYMFLFVCFVALRPKSTAEVMAGRSVHITRPTHFPRQACSSG